MAAAVSDIQLAVWTIYIIVTADVLGVTLIMPIFATYSKYLGAPSGLVGAQFTIYSGAAIGI